MFQIDVTKFLFPLVTIANFILSIISDWCYTLIRFLSFFTRLFHLFVHKFTAGFWFRCHVCWTFEFVLLFRFLLSHYKLYWSCELFLIMDWSCWIIINESKPKLWWYIFWFYLWLYINVWLLILFKIELDSTNISWNVLL